MVKQDFLFSLDKSLFEKFLLCGDASKTHSRLTMDKNQYHYENNLYLLLMARCRSGDRKRGDPTCNSYQTGG